MKKLLLLAITALAGVTAYGQGTVNFANFGSGGGGNVNSPVTNAMVSPSVRADGPAFMAQLYVGPQGTAAALLTTNGVSGTPQPFQTGAQAGYFLGSSRTISGVAGGTTLTMQVRAWATAAGSSWETAINGRGSSNPIDITLASGIATPPNLVGLQSFSITGVVPEPSSIALGLLGLGAIALFRRRK